jgi:hypothetical protein
MDVFIILILPIHEHGRSFHLLRTLISFFRDLKFLSYRSFTCSVRDTPTLKRKENKRKEEKRKEKKRKGKERKGKERKEKRREEKRREKKREEKRKKKREKEKEKRRKWGRALSTWAQRKIS